MNLNNTPTEEQLRQLLAGCNDRAGHHVLWVEKNGEVHISMSPAKPSLAGFQQSHPDMKLRYETFEKGNEYVGVPAAADEAWVTHLFASLVREWPKAKVSAEPAYVELPEFEVSG